MKLANFTTKFFLVIGIIFFTALTIFVSFFTIHRVSEYSLAFVFEICFAPLALIGVLIFIGLIFLKPIKETLAKININNFARFAFMWGLAVSLLWIFIANVLPMWDSADLISAANAINGTPDEYSAGYWSSGGYMERFSFQTPIVLLLVLCMKLAGSNFIILFEAFNCFACAFTMYFTVKLTQELFHKKSATVISGFLVMLFIPIILYCTFIYGNIICLPFALAGCLFQKRAMDSTTTSKLVKLAIISTILFALSVFFKSSMMIIIIAAAIVWLVWSIKVKRYIFIIFALAPLLLYKTLLFIPNTIISQHTDANLNNGVPKIAWIAMGVGAGLEYNADQTNHSELRENIIAPGYYDGFVWEPSNTEFNPNIVTENSQQYLQKRLEHYQSDPVLMLIFFGKKLAIEWGEPTFEGFLASNWGVTSPTTGYNMAERDCSALCHNIYYGKTHDVIYYIMDVIQTLLALGALLALVFYRRKFNITQITLLICVLGGALLYLFWESKTQYMFPFYLFMIPLAGLGFSLLANNKKILSLPKKFKTS